MGTSEHSAGPGPSTTVAIDAALARLHEHKDAWASAPALVKLRLVDTVRRDLARVASRWVRRSIEDKGLARGTLGEAEEWIFFAALLRSVRMLRGTLQSEAAGRVTQTRQGSTPGSIRAFPYDRWDRLLFPGVTGDVSTAPTVERGTSPDGGRVTLVLGAGNASPLAPVDVLHKLFVERKCVVLKPNPVNAYLGPLIEEGFAALIRHGCLAVVYGDTSEGQYLSTHDLVDELHLTGSHRTYEAIVFGPGAGGEARRSERAPVNLRPFSAELGNVSPIIVVPGAWSERDIAHQAEQVATWMTANAGFGCLTPRILILHRNWPQRPAFVAAFKQFLARTPTRVAFYPGAHQVHAEFVSSRPEATQIGASGQGHLPWTLIEDVDPAEDDALCFQKEAFCGLSAETAIEAPDVPTFIDRAVEFANTRLWGTLCASLIVQPASQRDAAVRAAIEQAIADLRYGTVTVNAFAFLSYYFGILPWGAYPGHETWDIQSGTGKVGNMLMIEGAQKSVLRAPFRRWPDDPIRVTSPRPHRFARRMAAFEHAPGVRRLPGLLWTGLTR